jgi:hypothetical protein
LGALALAMAACKGKDADASAPADAGIGPADAAPAEPEDDDEVRPVYPIDDKPPMPQAVRYCEATRGLPRKRREACCPSMRAYAPTDQCVRTLSSALRSGAVTVDAAAIDACVAAVAKDTEGCDWVTSTGTPTSPACLGILKGALKEGASCRSNLECEEGMRCLGLGATKPGKCAAPLAARSVCNLATDPLAVFTGQEDYDRRHPECAGACRVRQCVDAVPVGGACTASDACGPKGWCVAGKCAASAPLGGERCTDACGAGARCVKGTCVAPKGAGEACTADAECRAVCVSGRCAGQCPSFPGR